MLYICGQVENTNSGHSRRQRPVYSEPQAQQQECAEQGNKDTFTFPLQKMDHHLRKISQQQVLSDGLKKRSFRKVEGDQIPTVSQPEKPHQWGASL